MNGIVEDEKLNRLIDRFDLNNVLRSMVDPLFKVDGIEYEVSAELARRDGIKPRGVIVPIGAFARDLTVGTATAGGHTVATELHAKKFIDVLRPVSIIASLGATYLNGLVGGVKIPRQTGSGSAYWVAENGAPTESQQAFDQVSMTPKTLGAYTDISRKLMLQSSLHIADFVRNDLRASLAQELDRVVLNGSGSGNEPTGILNDANISTISLGTNGAALTWGNVVDLETTVTQNNAEGYGVGYVTTRQAKGKLSATSKVSGQNGFIWEPPLESALPGEGILNGARAVASALMPANLTKGSGTNLSSMICGNWQNLIVGNWGSGIELMVDPYTFSNTGAVRIIGLVDVDFVVRHPESFVKIKDILTT